MSAAALDFNAPASRERMAALLERLELGPHSRVLDVGCGRGLMLSMLAARTGCRGVGVDPKADEIAAARARGGPGAERLVWHAARIQDLDDQTDLGGPGHFDAILCIGASHAFGGPGEAQAAAFDALGPRLAPGGRLLLGEGFWQRDPPDDYLAATGMSRDELTSHAVNSARGVERGFSLLHQECSTPAEWDHFEGAFLAAAERARAVAPDDPETAERLGHWRSWNAAFRRWGRTTMGFGFYLWQAAPRAPTPKPLRNPSRFSH